MRYLLLKSDTIVVTDIIRVFDFGYLIILAVVDPYLSASVVNTV